ncbi:hypothetical protein EG19_04415 [Thermoanaerobaculum aquaticum]|uniref:Porin n=1 Tax=Thermoanaerobaculum aquaticum TaxID=1312852 RepID=A0A062XZC2_9BACT|nr:porin [Thermoanaerobaculum aquaticum]KDA53456.1 hypothetical protein EG19_04415 [Thermoanaerobaculum aquaticum]
MRKRWVFACLLLVFAELGFGQQNPTPADKAQPKFSVSWKDGKTSFDLEKAHLELSNRLQIRFALSDESSKPTVGSFRIRRFKTKLEGWAYSKDLTFELQLNWADDKPLEDANVAYDFSHGKKLFVLKGGQFKVPFGRQELTSSGSQQFVDRSLVSTEFARGRDIGVQLSGLALGGKLDWRVGAFNGSGRNATTNDNSKLQYDARVTWQPWGEVKYSESDFASSPKPLLALAGQYERNDRRGGVPTLNVWQETWGGDVTVVWRGFFGFAEYFQREQVAVRSAPEKSRGVAVQGGYFLLPSKLEMALRYAVLEPSNLASKDHRYEKGLAVNYFFNHHAHKLQADVRRVEDQRSGKKTWELRAQYQLIF